MTNREAIDVLKVLKAVCEETFGKGEVEAVQMAIDALEKQEWIHVSERLPEQGRPILFCDVDGDVFHGYYIDTPSKPSRWTEFSTSYSIVNVVAWMPQPKTHKGVDT